MKTKKLLLLITFIIFFGSLYSQIEHKLYFKVQGGVYSGSKTTGEYFVLLQEGMIYNATFGINLTKHIAANIGYNMLDTKSYSHNDGTDVKSSMIRHFPNIGLTYNILPQKKISPYMFANINVNRAELSIYELISPYQSQSHNITRLGASFGGGINLKLGLTWAIIADYSRNVGEIFNNNSFNFGIQYSFIPKNITF